MAELELPVRCRPLANRVGFYAMCGLFPVWALVAPFALGLLISWLLTRPGEADPYYAFLFMCWLSAVPVLGVMVTALFEDDRLWVSKSGMAFPLFTLPFLRLRRHRKWGELAQADIKRSLAPGKECLVLRFKSGEQVSLGRRCFPAADLEQLLLAVELWGGRQTRTPALVDYQHELQNENRGVGRPTYTQLWEEELSRRFAATAFVPLEPEQCLAGGKLKIIRQIAFGGLSAIYLAQHEERELVVLKEAVVPADADEGARSKAQEHFLREAALLQRLNHEQIARVHEHFVEGGRNYLVLEYVNGQDLRQYVREHGPVAQQTVVEWAKSIAGILAYLHAQDPPIIHRSDADNLVLRRDGSLTLIDFGAANQFVGTATGTLVGKQAYIAPEQLRGKASLPSDLYALGGTLFYLLTGRDPVPLSVSHPKALVPEISEDLDDLVAALTSLDVEKRIESAQALAGRLQPPGGIDAGSADDQAVAPGGIIKLGRQPEVMPVAARQERRREGELPSHAEPYEPGGPS